MRIYSSFVVLLLLGGCAAKTPAADAPEDEASEASSEDSASADAGDAPDDEGSGDDEASDAQAEGDEAKVAEDSPGSAERLLKQDGTAFLYDFSRSEAGEKAQQRCEKSSGDDAAKKANCMAKASKAVKPQGFRFLRDKENPDVWWFVRFEIKGNKPIEHNRVAAAFADDTGKKITVKTKGPDQARPAKGAVPASFEIELPDEYTLIIDEPGGKKVYEPKLGLFDEG
jgi:hypothetical protein